MGNCSEVLAVVEKNAGKAYRAPSKLTGTEAKEMTELYSECKEGESLFEQVVTKLAQDNKMVCSFHKNILDGTRTRIRTYYWGELQEQKYIASPESISVFAEKTPDSSKARYRVSLEIDGNRAAPEEFVKHNSVLDYPETKGCIYAINDGAARTMTFFEKASDAKNMLGDDSKKKVQVCVLLDDLFEKQDEDCIKALNDAVKTIHEYYIKIVK